jgi:hypothetical protein
MDLEDQPKQNIPSALRFKQKLRAKNIGTLQ